MKGARPRAKKRRARLFLSLPSPAFALGLFLYGCVSSPPKPPPPATTKLGSAPVTLPARMYGNILVVEAKWDRSGPYHFLIDTGSSVTLVTPELAERYGAADVPPDRSSQVWVRSSDGSMTKLPTTRLSRLDLGTARFGNIPALIYDCAPLTAQLGVKVDGVLGFSLFRQTLLTLDYPRARVILRNAAAPAILPGSAIPFETADKTPLIEVGVGKHLFPAIVDSGSNDILSLNPARREFRFAFGPTGGPTVGTLTGDRVERVGRLAETLHLGKYAIDRPVVQLTDQISSLGGGILKYFTVSFDQQHERVIFYRESADSIAVPSLRTVGLSYDKTPVYWRVVGVIHGSPADLAKIQPGDLVTRIDGDPVALWDTGRYEKLLASATEAAFIFLNGTQTRSVILKVVDLVP